MKVERTFLRELPLGVARQRRLLERLLAAIETDTTYRWLELAGSLTRGAGDRHSDIDAGVGISDETWSGAVDRTEELLATLDPVVDRFRQRMPGHDGESSWHLVTLYDGGLQLSLVVMPASWRAGLPPGAVAIYDVDGRLARPWEPGVLEADDQVVTEWVYLAWIALGDLAKYLDRGSLWEAHARLHEARERVWQLTAYGQRLDYPAFGLTTVLDASNPTLPDGIERTVAGLDVDDLRRAAHETAKVLDDVAGFHPPLADWALARLASK